MIHIATIPKNGREEIRVTLEEFRGHQPLNLRVWYDAGGDEYRPGNKGLSVRLDTLPSLRAALEAAESEAELAGLLERGAA